MMFSHEILPDLSKNSAVHICLQDKYSESQGLEKVAQKNDHRFVPLFRDCVRCR
jgi:hypothetical protein